VTDRQTDRQTDKIAIAIAVSNMLSARQKGDIYFDIPLVSSFPRLAHLFIALFVI